MLITTASGTDCRTLAATSRRAFEADPEVGAPGVGGPPGYDSPDWHEAALGWGQVFTITHDGRPVGGAIVYVHSPLEARLARLWLVPEAQNQRLGREAIATLEARFPEVTRWTLDTPAWNTRNHHFYERCGYRAIGTEGGDGILFEKRLPGREPGPGGESVERPTRPG